MLQTYLLVCSSNRWPGTQWKSGSGSSCSRHAWHSWCWSASSFVPLEHVLTGSSGWSHMSSNPGIQKVTEYWWVLWFSHLVSVCTAWTKSKGIDEPSCVSVHFPAWRTAHFRYFSLVWSCFSQDSHDLHILLFAPVSNTWPVFNPIAVETPTLDECPLYKIVQSPFQGKDFLHELRYLTY